MGWLTVVLLILLVLLGWIFLAPLVLQIDTDRNVYRLSWLFGFLRADARGEPDDIRLRLKVAFWQKSWALINDLLTENGSPEPFPSNDSPESSKKRKRRKRKRSPRRVISLARAALRSFRVREFTLHLDTDDFVWNAWLFPLFYFLRSERRDDRVSATIVSIVSASASAAAVTGQQPRERNLTVLLLGVGKPKEAAASMSSTTMVWPPWTTTGLSAA